MITFSIRAWSAWAPGLQSSEDWSRWARAPVAPQPGGSPELKFIPAMVRRRFSRLSRMALQVAFDATPPELLADVSTVFASRHGESNACIALLSDIARGMPLSPTAFSHAVHNAQAGLFSIAAESSRASSAIAAMEHTFCAGLVEALGLCERQRPRPTLLVVADEPPPEMFSEFQDELACAFGLAMLIEEGGGHGAPAFRIAIEERRIAQPAAPKRLPQGLGFLAWMLGEESELALPYGERSWRFFRERA